jgi:hypothetical protein
VDLMRVKGEAQWLHKRSSMRLLLLDVFVDVCAANHTELTPTTTICDRHNPAFDIHPVR